ncbi:plasma membrane ATPase 2-like [Tasmannia lanceolata]|uniref:plasma membrane ATPase 2-like n=1 Tax=Tasmannia lanceolata TaxID=3420 RepID=UPI004062B403
MRVLISQSVATVISAEANWKFTGIKSIGWRWTGVVWLFNIVTYMFLEPLKFCVQYALSGKAWGSGSGSEDGIYKPDFGREVREAAWARERRTLHALQSIETKMFADRTTFRDINMMVEEAKRCAEIARLREHHTLKGRVESFAKLKGLDIDAINQHYTL